MCIDGFVYAFDASAAASLQDNSKESKNNILNLVVGGVEVDEEEEEEEEQERVIANMIQSFCIATIGVIDSCQFLLRIENLDGDIVKFVEKLNNVYRRFLNM